MKAIAVAALVALASTASPSPAPPASSAAIPAGATPAVYLQGADPIEDARRVAHEVPFSGTVEVSWREGGQVHTEQFQVRGGEGAVMVDGRADPVLEMPERRLARGHGDDWALLWSPAFGPSTAVPELALKYETVRVAEAPPVAGRGTDAVEIRDDGRVRVRLYTDEQTGLLLRREQFDRSGREERTVAFRELSLDPSVPAPRLSPKVSALLAQQAPTFRPAVAPAAPEVLGDGYVRLGVYRRGDVVQMHYSDGLFELSVFEESGRLDGDELPSGGRTVAVGEGEAKLYSWPGGRLLVWQSGPVVRTAVSDAPADQLLEAAGQMPGSGKGRPSLLEKLRRACSVLIDPLP